MPTQYGFDAYDGLPYSNDMGRPTPRVGSPPLPLMVDAPVIEEQPDQTSLTERYAEQAVRFIRQHRDAPFSLYLVHMYVPDRFLQTSRNDSYGAAAVAIDWVTAVIVETSHQNGLEHNTVIIFTSDNGSWNDCPGSNGPLRGQKGTTWEGGMRVPCIMSWPGTIAPGQVCSEATSAVDFFPTLVSLAGGEVADAQLIDGKDISPLLWGDRTASAPHPAFFYYRGNILEAVPSGPWKLHVQKNGQPMQALYDLEVDPGETRDVYHAHPDVVASLSKWLDVVRQDLGDEAMGSPGTACPLIGHVPNPQSLTTNRPDYPYMMAIYDLADFG